MTITYIHFVVLTCSLAVLIHFLRGIERKLSVVILDGIAKALCTVAGLMAALGLSHNLFGLNLASWVEYSFESKEQDFTGV